MGNQMGNQSMGMGMGNQNMRGSMGMGPRDMGMGMQNRPTDQRPRMPPGFPRMPMPGLPRLPMGMGLPGGKEVRNLGIPFVFYGFIFSAMGMGMRPFGPGMRPPMPGMVSLFRVLI